PEIGEQPVDRQSSGGEERGCGGVEPREIAWIKDDAGRITVTPGDQNILSIGQHELLVLRALPFFLLADRLRDGPLIFRTCRAETVFQTELRAPILSSNDGFRHHRLDASGAERGGDFFQLARAAFAVLDDASDRIPCKFAPVHSGIGLFERGEYALVRAVT